MTASNGDLGGSKNGGNKKDAMKNNGKSANAPAKSPAKPVPSPASTKGNKQSKSFKSEDVESLMKTISQLTGAKAPVGTDKTSEPTKISDTTNGTTKSNSATTDKLAAIKAKNNTVNNKDNNSKSLKSGTPTDGKKTPPTAAKKITASTPKNTVKTTTNSNDKAISNWWLNNSVDGVQLQMDPESSWYTSGEHTQPLRTLEKVVRLTVDSSKLSLIQAAVVTAYDNEVAAYQKAKGSKLSGDQKWINDVLKSGTISDKVAALALVVQESPIHELSALDTLIGLASKKEYRTAQLALDAVKDLLIHNLLPDRRLISFKNQPFNHPDINIQIGMLYWFEEQLLQRVELVANALDLGLKSTIEYFKKQCMDIAADLLAGKPEKEARFLAMIVNKLGDPSGAIGSKCIELLRTVIRKHPAMKCIVVREVRQLIYRPNLAVRAVHSGIVFLSQVILVKGDHDVAAQLVECYMSLFEKAVTQDELGSRLLSSLLSGLDRAFPFLDNKEPIAKHVDSLFRIIHSASFSTSTRALMLISHIALADTDAEAAKRLESANKTVSAVSDKETHLVSRFYRSLYSKLLSPQISTRAYNTLFLNLLFRSLKRDPSDLRVMAFLKRLGICALQSSAPIAAGLLFLMSEVYRARPNLLKMMTSVEVIAALKVNNEEKGKNGKNKGNKEDDSDDEGEDGSSSHQLGNFEASKREPAFSVTDTPALWEASLLRNHFHPSVRSFSASLLDPPHVITFAGDPTTEFSLNAFLNRFAYKNPKKQHSDKIRRPQAVGEEPLNTASFLKTTLSDVAPDKKFFHKFFGEKEKLRVEGKSRDRSKRRQHDDDGGDDDASMGSDDDEVNFDEKAIDKFATKLAEDMMREKDDDIDIDDDYSDSGDDSEGSGEGFEGEEGSDMGGGDGSGSDGGEDFDMGGSDDEDENVAMDFEDFKDIRERKADKKADKKAEKAGKGEKGGKVGKEVVKEEKGKKAGRVDVKGKKKVDEDSDDEYELTAFGDEGDECEDEENDDDEDGFSDMDEEDIDDDDEDDEDEDDLSLAFADEMPSKSKYNNVKKGKGKKPAGDMSDFASADDYEDQMEEIVGRYSGSATEINENILKRKKSQISENKVSKIVKGKKLRKN